MKNKRNSLFLKAKSYKLKACRGFALVELLVAVAIFGIITMFVMVAYSRISGQLFLSTLAYEIALSFRQAQSYGVSVHQFQGGTGSATFDNGYGLHFDSGSLVTYATFSDEGGIDGNKIFNSTYEGGYDMNGCYSGNTECISVSKLEKGNRIEKFCGVRAGTGDSEVEECSDTQVISYMDVTFLRPDPDAIIRTSASGPQVLYKAARVYIISPSGNTRRIEAWNTGQISIK